MCGLCGILGGRGHWTDPATNPDAFGGRTETRTWRRERQDRTTLVNRVLGHYGLGLKDWGGTAYVLRGGTGKTKLVDNLSQMWAEAEAMSGCECDPLDETLIARLTRNARG